MADRRKCSACGQDTACTVCGAPSDTCWDTHYEGSCGDDVCANKECERYGQTAKGLIAAQDARTKQAPSTEST